MSIEIVHRVEQSDDSSPTLIDDYPQLRQRLKDQRDFIVYKGDCLPREERFVASLKDRDVHATLYQSPVEVGNMPILLSPGFTAGEKSFSTLQKELARLGWPSISISHPRLAPSTGKSVEQMHSENDYEVMSEATQLYGFDGYHALGASMGGGDVALLATEANNNNHDQILSVTTLNGMGQIEGDHLRRVAWRMAKALGKDALLLKSLTRDEQLHDIGVAANSIGNMAANFPLTLREALYASSFDVRGLYENLGSFGMHISQILSENDSVFHPEKVLPDTEHIDFDNRTVIVGKYATHVSFLFMPKATAKAITDGLPLAA